jgi:hypothetical protein
LARCHGPQRGSSPCKREQKSPSRRIRLTETDPLQFPFGKPAQALRSEQRRSASLRSASDTSAPDRSRTRRAGSRRPRRDSRRLQATASVGSLRFSVEDGASAPGAPRHARSDAPGRGSSPSRVARDTPGCVGSHSADTARRARASPPPPARRAPRASTRISSSTEPPRAIGRCGVPECLDRERTPPAVVVRPRLHFLPPPRTSPRSRGRARPRASSGDRSRARAIAAVARPRARADRTACARRRSSTHSLRVASRPRRPAIDPLPAGS